VTVVTVSCHRASLSSNTLKFNVNIVSPFPLLSFSFRWDGMIPTLRLDLVSSRFSLSLLFIRQLGPFGQLRRDAVPTQMTSIRRAHHRQCFFGSSWHQWTRLCPRGWYVLPTQTVFDLVSVVLRVYGFDLPIPSNFFWPSFVSPGITTPMLILSASHFLPFSF
jgi:hypothetical protein